MPTLLYIEQYFYPEGWGGAEIPRDIVSGLRQAGFAVEVLCGKDQYTPMRPGEVPDPSACGVRIFRVPRIAPGPIHRFKSLRILWFCTYAFPWLLMHRGVDLYITQTNPPLIVPTLAMVAALRGKPFVIIAQDLFPEAVFASGLAAAGSLPGKSLRRLFGWAYRRASAVVALGAFMRRRILEKGVSPQRVHTISNWATGDTRRISASENPLRTEWGLRDRFVLLYSGNMGVSHEFETLLGGVQRAAAAGADLVVVFIGGGVRLPEVRALVASLGLSERVVFRNFVPADVLPLSLGVADLALVTLRAGFEGVVVPSKLLGYMARGIPVLYVGPDSDAAQLVRESLAGACCASGDPQAVADVLLRTAGNGASQLRRWGESGRSFYAQHLARELGVGRYVELIRALFAQEGGSPRQSGVARDR
jgi:putative colanic acid biosynthesis glycosyltransferase WcaI